MKIITRAELLKCPKGTIYRCIEGLCWDDDWRRFEEATDFNDWYYSDIGPNLSTENGGRAEISNCMQRDAIFLADTTQYMVLDEVDILAIIKQLLGGMPNGQEIVLPLQFDADGAISTPVCVATTVDQWRKSLYVGWRKIENGVRSECWVRYTSERGLYYWLHPTEGRWVGEPEQKTMPTFPTYEKATEAAYYCEKPEQ